MKIHSSAKFDNKTFSYHNEIELNLTAQQIAINQQKIVNLSLSKFKEKCENHFKVEFATMCFFDVYFWSIEENKEINLFKKEKTT